MPINDELRSRIIIFDNYPCDCRDGGPSGFIGQNFRGEQGNQFSLASTYIKQSSRLMVRLRKLLAITTAIARQIPKSQIPLRKLFWRRWMKASVFLFANSNLKFAKRIYFHDVFSLYFCLPLISHHQQIIFQPHMPELPHEEIAALDGMTAEDIMWVKKVTNIAFQRADILVFPNAGAKEIYRSLIENNHKIIYCASGAKPQKHLNQIPLSDDYIYFLFIGRRNLIKGFDLLKLAFERAFEYNKSIRLILIGKGCDWSHPGVIDIGPSTTPHNWMSSVDYVVNTNRQSYFDLSIIECLSVGTPIIFTPTFGHRELLTNKSNGLIALKRHSSDSNIVESLADLFANPPHGKTCNKSDLRGENLSIFSEKYSSTSYIKRLEYIFEHDIINPISFCTTQGGLTDC